MLNMNAAHQSADGRRYFPLYEVCGAPLIRGVGIHFSRGGGSFYMLIFKRVIFALISVLTLYIGNV